MPEVTRIVRSSYTGRDDDYDSDDGRSHASHSRGDGSYRTVQRYRVTPVTSSRTEEVDVDRRSRLDIDVGRNRLEVERRDRFDIERPRSALELRPHSTVVERERFAEREPIREPEHERTRTVVYERDRSDPDRRYERARPWESERDVTIEKRTTERTERRERDEPYELDRYTRETEYYDREPAPIVIRERAREPQKIILQEAPAPLPIVLPPSQQEVQIVRREEQEIARPRQEDEYYYRRDVREIGPRRDEDWQVAAAVDRREIRPRDSVSDESDGSDYVITKRIIRRERSRSHSPHHKRHLAEGALAGAGVAALVANHRDKQGDGPEHRGRKVIGGAALGALATEVVTRARSRYRESQDDRSRSRSRSSSRHSHRKIKTGLALAALGLGAAAAAKYVSNRRTAAAEEGRGRSRTRSVSRRRGSGGYDDYDDYDDRDNGRSRSRHQDPNHRRNTIAKAGVATAAVAGVVEHFRNKSRKRSGERSKSRIRTGAEIAATGLAGAAVAGLYENRKAKKEQEAEEEENRRERRRSRSRSRARSTGAYSDPGVDPELGMVQYGTEPVYTQQTTTVHRGYDYDPALAAGAAGATREHRSRSHRHRHRRHSESPSSSSSVERERKHSRSRSRVRDIAGAAAGTAAAAIGISQYKKRKEKKEAERERQRRRYEEEASPPPENYYARNDYRDDDYSPSPPHASGGSYYPQTNQFAPPPTATGGFTQHPNDGTTHLNDGPIPPYNPQDYAAQQPTAPVHDTYGYPPGYPPGPGNNAAA